MKLLTAFFLLVTSTAFASGPGNPPGFTDFGEAAASAELVVFADPIRVSARYFIEGKEMSAEEVRKFYLDHLGSLDDFPIAVVQYTVTVKVIASLNGKETPDELTFTWKDLYDSMCPHIPFKATESKGIWYSGERVVKGAHDHAIYWISELNKHSVVEEIRKQKAAAK